MSGPREDKEKEEIMAGNDQTDIVVIGSGACGLVAALTAAEAGAKVIVVVSSVNRGHL